MCEVNVVFCNEFQALRKCCNDPLFCIVMDFDPFGSVTVTFCNEMEPFGIIIITFCHGIAVCLEPL